MEQKIFEEILKECKDWRERLLVKIFPKTFVKAYHVGRIKGFNYMAK